MCGKCVFELCFKCPHCPHCRKSSRRAGGQSRRSNSLFSTPLGRVSLLRFLPLRFGITELARPCLRTLVAFQDRKTSGLSPLYFLCLVFFGRSSSLNLAKTLAVNYRRGRRYLLILPCCSNPMDSGGTNHSLLSYMNHSPLCCVAAAAVAATTTAVALAVCRKSATAAAGASKKQTKGPPTEFKIRTSGKSMGVGVAVFVLNEAHPGCILLGKRIGSDGCGTFGLPGGHLEYGETLAACAARETLEETGLEVVEGSMRCAGVCNAVEATLDYHYVVPFMVCLTKGLPKRMEPGKCEGWNWVKWSDHNFPAPLFSALRKVREAGFDPTQLNPPQTVLCE